MKKGIKRVVLDFVAKTGLNCAIVAAGSASCFGYHQPKEPSGIETIKKK